ncbi:MAG: hypothetical protein KAI24_17125 [Planctomycetes bacterium]|nr:hypothetical protein [Planctomycetota bacterium]
MKAVALIVPVALMATLAAQGTVGSPPQAEVERLKLSPFYEQHLSADGLPIVSSSKVSPFALLEARYVVDRMLEGREDIRRKLIENKVRLAVMAVDEMTTAIPEHATLQPAKYWDRRARGLGATRHRPAVSCGEENLLRYPGDPYHQESILVHEFAHAIHAMALVDLDATFDERLQRTWREAVKAGLWQGKYAATNHSEYWAEGVQSWFDDNRPPDHDHNHVDTRAELREYDPGLARLCEQVFGDRAWRYQKPALRDANGRAHLAGHDPAHGKRFRWPEGLEEWYRDHMRKKGRHSGGR